MYNLIRKLISQEDARPDLEKAEGDFMKKCRKMGINYWGNGEMGDDSSYSMGLTFDWPNMKGARLQKQVDSVYNSAKKVAEKYNFSPIFEGPGMVAGGALGMLVGFGEKTEMEQKPGSIPRINTYRYNEDGALEKVE